MEAVPRLPMINFDIGVSTEIVSFAAKLKQYISNFYHEDPESYNNEIHSLESLRSAAVRPSFDVSGCQLLKKYYCQLHFLKSRFPMEDGQSCATYFSWRNTYSNMMCSVPDVDFELMNVLYDIGAVHSKLGAEDSRVTPEGMKMACTHFQCAAWAFQVVRETYPQMVSLVLAPEIIQYMHLTCLAQAQECILEKSMMDNRKPTIIAKVAIQVVEYYKQALTTLQTTSEDGSISDLLSSRTYKDWIKYLNFKIAYHKSIALLYQGQQAEEQQKMGERVAFYQAASDQLQEACKRANNLQNQQQISEALAFTGDVVEGKKKAAKNENEFIYHEDVPDKDALQEVKGASLVKGISFSVNDFDVSGPDIFAKLVPMEAHEAASLYSEHKAKLLRHLGEVVDTKDHELTEFMSSMQLEILTQMRQASGLTQDVVDRAAAMSARPTAIQDLVTAMGKLSNTYHDVEAMLTEIDTLLKDEEKKEQEYQSQMGTRPPSIIATDLTREYTKYQEAHSKASDSNQNLHKAMTTHVANLKILAQPLSQLNSQIPSVQLPHPDVDENVLREVETLLSKVDEMKNQRAMLWAQFHDAVKNDDITGLLVTPPPDLTREQLFHHELQKHRRQAILLEQNMSAQENILKAFIEVYARFTNTRRYLQDVVTKRGTTISALINSYDTYDDLLSKANKGLDFYNKLETNVTKLLQRIKSTCSVQDEEREQMLAKHNKKKPAVPPNSGPKLRDFLETKVKDVKKTDSVPGATLDTINSPAYTLGVSGGLPNVPDPTWPPAVRPAPLGSEMTSDTLTSYSGERDLYSSYVTNPSQVYYNPTNSSATTTMPNLITNYTYIQPYVDKHVEEDLSNRMTHLMSDKQVPVDNRVYAQQQPYQSYGYAPIVNSTNPEVLPNQNIYNQPQSGGVVYTNAVSSTTESLTTYSAANYPYQSTNYIYDASVQKPTAGVAYNPSISQQAYNDNAPAYSPNVQYSNTYSQSITTPSNYSQADAKAFIQPMTATTSYLPTSTNLYIQPVPAPNADVPALSSSYGQYVIPQSSYSYVPAASIPNAYTQADGNMYTQTVQAEQTIQPTQANIYNQTMDQAETYQNVYGNPILPNQTSAVYPEYGTQQYDGNVSNPLSQTYNMVATNYYPYTGQMQDIASAYGSNTVGQMSANVSAGYVNYAAGTVVNRNIPTNANNTISSNVVAEQPTKEQSNIDLLSGLDFTINQVPLMPQPNKLEVATKDASTPKSVEQSAINPSKPCSSNVKLEQEKLGVAKEPTIKERKHAEMQFQRNSFQDPDTVKQFSQETEKFEKFVDVLTTKTLNGPTLLDLKWKEIQDKQDIEQQKKSISVARCYPMKNRFPDILPYDQTRVKLSSTKDDYINASYIKDISPHSPVFIVTQSPTQSTYNEFWTMVCEQEIEVIVCLLNDNEIEQEIYWPKESDKPFLVGNVSISIQTLNVKEYWTDTVLCINLLEQRTSRTVRHIQFTAWPGSLFPATHIVVNYVNEILKDQKALTRPILIHCLAGIGRSGLLCLLLTVMSEVLVNPSALPDLPSIAVKLTSARKNIIRDREHFKFAYYVFLSFLKELHKTHVHEKRSLKDVPVLTSQSSTVSNNPIDDPLSMLDPLWATRKNI